MSKLKLVLQKISKRKFKPCREFPKPKNSTQVCKEFSVKSAADDWTSKSMKQVLKQINTVKFIEIFLAKTAKSPLRLKSRKKGAAKPQLLVGILRPPKSFFCFQTAHKSFWNPESVQFRWPILVFLGQKEKGHIYRQFFTKSSQIEPENCPPARKNPSCS